MKIKVYLTSLFTFLTLTASYSQNINGNLEGHIVDTSAVPIEGVNILLEGINLQGIRGSTTNENGYFRILNLPVGLYKAKISFIGYRNIIFENVQVSLDRTTNLGEIVLKVKVINIPEITISDKKSGIDPASTTYGSNINSADFQNLPVDRNFGSIATLLPQTNVSYYNFDGANIGGATGFENKYFIDGVDVTDPLLGTSNVLTSIPRLPYNFIREIEIKTGGYGADSRSSLGGLINVITYSGSNEFHGNVFGFYTGNQFSANRKLGLRDVSQGDFSDYDIGFGLGGPVILDKLWFYIAYNPAFNRRNVELPGYGTYIDKTVTHSFAVKLSWKASDNLNIIFTTTGDPIDEYAVGRNGVGNILANPDAVLENLVTGSVSYSLNSTYVINKNISLQGIVARVDRYFTVEGATERAKNEIRFQDSETHTWSGGTGVTRDASRRSYNGKIEGSVVLKDHTLIGGFEYKTSSVNTIYDEHALYRSAGDKFTEVIYRGFGDVSNRIPSFYIKDVWRIIEWLNINLGVRWDDHYIVGSNNKVVQKISVPLQPRIGFVIIPDKNNMQRIFGSFGRYSNEFPLWQSINYFTENGYELVLGFDHDPRIDSTGGKTIGYSPRVIRPEVKDLQSPYYDEFSFGYERLIKWDIKVGIQGVYRILRQTIDDTWLPEKKDYQFGNPGRGILSDLPKPERNYSSLIFTIERNGDKHFNFLASYVLSRNYGNYEGFFSSFFPTPLPNQGVIFDDIAASRINTTGLLPNDRTHVFKFSGYYNFPFGFITGISFTAQSGTPLSEFFGTEHGIQFLSPRGSNGRTPTTWDLSARLIYNLNFVSKWNSKLILDFFHIASQSKPVDINQYKYYSSDKNGNPDLSSFNTNYGLAFRYQPSMSVRLGMEVSF